MDPFVKAKTILKIKRWGKLTKPEQSLDMMTQNWKTFKLT